MNEHDIEYFLLSNLSRFLSKAGCKNFLLLNLSKFPSKTGCKIFLRLIFAKFKRNTYYKYFLRLVFSQIKRNTCCKYFLTQVFTIIRRFFNYKSSFLLITNVFSPKTAYENLCTFFHLHFQQMIVEQPFLTPSKILSLKSTRETTEACP